MRRYHTSFVVKIKQKDQFFYSSVERKLIFIYLLIYFIFTYLINYYLYIYLFIHLYNYLLFYLFVVVVFFVFFYFVLLIIHYYDFSVSAFWSSLVSMYHLTFCGHSFPDCTISQLMKASWSRNILLKLNFINTCLMLLTWQ